MRPWGDAQLRYPRADSLDASSGRRVEKTGAEGIRTLRFGRESVDLGAVDQLVDPAQVRAIGRLLAMAPRLWMEGAHVAELLDRMERFLDEEGLDPIGPFHEPGRHPGCFARARRFEVAAALARLRTLRVEQR